MKKLILAFLICTSTSVFAQKTNFSGTWKLDTTKTTFKTASGDAPKDIIPWTVKIDQQSDQLVLTRISIDSAMHDQAPVKETLAFDGTPLQRTSDGAQVTTAIHWLNYASFSLSRSGHKLIASENWTLEDAGNTLVVDRTVQQKSNGFKYAIRCYYQKK
jgi:hypothetical protein